MRSSIVGLVSRRLLFTVLVVVSCFCAAVPSGVARDELKEQSGADQIERGAGLDGDSRWVSPQFGVEAEWDESWLATVNRTWSDPEIGEDRLLLEWSGHPRGDLYVLVRETGRGGASADVETWTSDDFLGLHDVDDVEVLLADGGNGETDGAVLMALSDESLPYPLFHYKQSVANEDGLGLYVLIEAPESVFLGAWEAAENGFTLNGAAVDLRFDLDEIETAMASYEAVEYSEEGAGRVGPRAFEGPVCGVSLEWNSSWEMNADLEFPIISDPLGLTDELFMRQVGAGDFGPYLDVQAVGSVFTNPAERIDWRTHQDAMEMIWGPSVESELVLREVRDDHAEALVKMTFSDESEAVYMWSRYTWIEETQCNAYIELTAPASAFEEAWIAVTGEFDIQVAGAPLGYLLSWSAIDDAME